MTLLIELEFHNFLLLYDHHKRLIIHAISKKHWLIEAKSNLTMTLRTVEQVAVNPLVILTRYLCMTDWTRRNIAKATVWTNRREGRTNHVPTVLATLTNWLPHFFHFDTTGVSVIV
ncbi:MAG: hypothetical protein DWI24_10925 [Planctomycetota bacterium]|nr:MAG: hypothetical protein DWI24_10925 [Planctomycetota bacterium]